ncbi:capsule biosynthesis protein CapA-like [Hydractinia symbiolongicarpus]|uniref:capsule biosynthesis protein CapA-like n=1 Tax=Hydractinia symbiolongicarpus TaxID=13093 RepID=UPI00254C98EA|nr:capsule biosynthesis protein CapA-like [Hydractinia symbiolongicarpus]
MSYTLSSSNKDKTNHRHKKKNSVGNLTKRLSCTKCSAGDRKQLNMQFPVFIFTQFYTNLEKSFCHDEQKMFKERIYLIFILCLQMLNKPAATLGLLILANNVKLIFGGDVTFSEVIKYHVRRMNCTYNESFSPLKPYLSEADHVIVNLESPFHPYNGKKLTELERKKIVKLISDLDAMPTLRARIDVVTLANNHFIDFGEEPANITIENLKRLHIAYFGVTYGRHKILKQDPLIIRKNGIRIGFLGYCATNEGCSRGKYRRMAKVGPAVYNKMLVIKELKILKKKVDVVIVFMHWGDEYSTELPKKLGQKIIIRVAPYADIIIGCHPHITQDHFYHKDVLVVPSLGNLLFPSHGTVMNKSNLDKVWYKEAKVVKPESANGKLVKIEINKNGLIKNKAKYLSTQTAVSDKHCMYVRKRDNSSWQTICGENDENCEGTSDCNVLQCDDQRKVKPNEVHIKVERVKSMSDID